MRDYYPDFWDIFGITPLTIWDLPLDDFLAMAGFADQVRADRNKPQPQPK